MFENLKVRLGLTALISVVLLLVAASTDAKTTTRNCGRFLLPWPKHEVAEAKILAAGTSCTTAEEVVLEFRLHPGPTHYSSRYHDLADSYWKVRGWTCGVGIGGGGCSRGRNFATYRVLEVMPKVCAEDSNSHPPVPSDREVCIQDLRAEQHRKEKAKAERGRSEAEQNCAEGLGPPAGHLVINWETEPPEYIRNAKGWWLCESEGERGWVE